MVAETMASCSCSREEDKEKGRVKPVIQSLFKGSQSFPGSTPTPGMFLHTSHQPLEEWGREVADTLEGLIN